jgi:hypothetical protein
LEKTDEENTGTLFQYLLGENFKKIRGLSKYSWFAVKIQTQGLQITNQNYSQDFCTWLNKCCSFITKCFPSILSLYISLLTISNTLKNARTYCNFFINVVHNC